MWILFTLLACLLFAALMQLAIIRIALRDAQEPYWSEIRDALWEVHAAMGLKWLAKGTMWIGVRLWPAVKEKE
jgi:hypothetical protein